MAERRKDSKKRVLKEGEYQRSNGTYEYRWRSENGKRNNVYAKSLEELREKEAEIQRDRKEWQLNFGSRTRFFGLIVPLSHFASCSSLQSRMIRSMPLLMVL